MKKLFILMILFVMVSCKSLDITSASKTLVKIGSQFGKDYIDYVINVSSDEDFEINTISLENNNKKINYYYTNKKTGESSYELQKPFKKGVYSFHFQVNDKTNFKKDEVLIISYSYKGKEVSKKISIVKNKKINYNR